MNKLKRRLRWDRIALITGVSVLVICLLIYGISFVFRSSYPQSMTDTHPHDYGFGSHTMIKQKTEHNLFVLHHPQTDNKGFNEYVDRVIDQSKAQFTQLSSEYSQLQYLVDYEITISEDIVALHYSWLVKNQDDVVYKADEGKLFSQASQTEIRLSDFVNQRGLRMLSHEVRKQLPEYSTNNRIQFLSQTNPSSEKIASVYFDQNDLFLYFDHQMLYGTAGDCAPVHISLDTLQPYLTQSFAGRQTDSSLPQQSYYLETGANPEEKLISITFDDGPKSRTDKRIIELFRKYNGQATFFMLGLEVGGKDDLLKELMDNGHQLANHTYSHKNLLSLNDTELNEQITYMDDYLKKTVGYDYPIMLRPPYGAIDDECAAKIDHPIIRWNVDSDDWKYKHNTDKIVANVMDNVQDNSIILMHDIYDHSVDSLEIILEKLAQQGYRFVSVDELLRANNIPIENGKVYFNGQKR